MKRDLKHAIDQSELSERRRDAVRAPPAKRDPPPQHVEAQRAVCCTLPRLLHGAVLYATWRTVHGAWCPQVQRHVERLEHELDALAALRTLATDAAPFDPQPHTPASA